MVRLSDEEKVQARVWLVDKIKNCQCEPCQITCKLEELEVVADRHIDMIVALMNSKVEKEEEFVEA